MSEGAAAPAVLAGRRILVVAASLHKGGAESVAAQLATGWTERGAAVTHVTVLDGPDAIYLDPRVSRASLAHGGAKSSVALRFAGQIASVRRLRAIIASSQPDVIVAHEDRTNVMALLAARGSRVPVVVVEHNDPDYHPIGRLWSALRRVTYARAARIVGVSDGVRQALARHYGPRAITIYNPLMLHPPADRQAPGDGCRIVAMGRLVPQKGFDLLIPAFAQIADRHPDATLTIWGRGPDADALRRLADGTKCAQRITLAGFTTSPQDALRGGDIFVMSSRYEGFGLALAEAMAEGLAVITTDCPSGPAEIVRDGIDGLVVPPNDSTALATALERLLSDSGLRQRLAGCAVEVKERFTARRALETWDHVLDAVIRESGGGPGESVARGSD